MTNRSTPQARVHPAWGAAWLLSCAAACPAAESPPAASENLTGDRFEMAVSTPAFSKPGCNRSPLSLPRGAKVRVLSSDTGEPDELQVAVVEAGATQAAAGEPCSISTDETLVASARALKRFGAIRTGWVYGVLTLPYKYHFDDKSLGSSMSIGPYLGRRSAAFGHSFTWAATAGLSSVQVASAAGGSTAGATSTVQAVSLAIGVMFDVTKSAKPFKVGLFVGQDRAGSKTPTPYEHEGKAWLALQLGWDFTD